MLRLDSLAVYFNSGSDMYTTKDRQEMLVGIHELVYCVTWSIKTRKIDVIVCQSTLSHGPWFKCLHISLLHTSKINMINVEGMKQMRLMQEEYTGYCLSNKRSLEKLIEED